MANTFVVKLPAVGNATIEPFNEEDSYKQLSEAVGGLIESAPIPTPLVAFDDCEIDCFVNENGLLEGLPVNQRLTALCTKTYGGLIVGDAIFVGCKNKCVTIGLPEVVAKAILELLRKN